MIERQYILSFQGVEKALAKRGFVNELQKLKARYKDKKIILYGAGLVFQVIARRYDLSGFNIIGISDKKFELDYYGECEGYRKIRPSQINDCDADVLVVTMLYIPNIYKSLKKQFGNMELCHVLKPSFSCKLKWFFINLFEHPVEGSF